MEEQIFKKPLFGGSIIIHLYDIDRIFAQGILDEAYEEALRLEMIFNFFDEQSELSELNRDRELHDASYELIEVIERAIELGHLSEGEYDISKGKNFVERKKGLPLTDVACSFKDIRIEGKDILLEHDDILIDLGSIAKGYIIDRIVELLQEEGVESGMVEGRGDLRVFGNVPVSIDIRHPRESGSAIKSFQAMNSSVATSGDYNQYDTDFDRPHILNSKDLISVTVAADSLFEADAFATALFVVNENIRRKLLSNKNIKAFCVFKDLGTRTYNGFR